MPLRRTFESDSSESDSIWSWPPDKRNGVLSLLCLWWMNRRRSAEGVEVGFASSHMAEDAAFRKQPGRDRDGSPHQDGQCKCEGGGEVRKANPAGQGEACQADGAEHRAGAIDAGDRPPTIGSVESCPGLVLLFVRFHHACSRGEDRGKGQKKPAEAGAESPGDKAGCHAHRSAKEEPHRPLVKRNAFECRESRLNHHPIPPAQ